MIKEAILKLFCDRACFNRKNDDCFPMCAERMRVESLIDSAQAPECDKIKNPYRFTPEQVAIAERFFGFCNFTSISNRVEFGPENLTEVIWTAEIQGEKAEDHDKFKAMKKVLDAIDKENGEIIEMISEKIKGMK